MPSQDKVRYFHPLVHGGLDITVNSEQPLPDIVRRVSAQLSVICMAELDGWSSGASELHLHLPVALYLHAKLQRVMFRT